MPASDLKRVSDPIHGSIGLTKLEQDVVGSRAFQRLRNIKQLGLAHYVFPNADYSRFSHSLGVCHVVSRMCEVLAIEGEERKHFRLAGLCHDIGHYPYSHTMEHANNIVYPPTRPLFEGSEPDSDVESPKAAKHEPVGAEVLTRDPRLKSLDGECNWKRVAELFQRTTESKYRNIISSDLDADRIDYLLRTAHHTGLPYGVDIEYLLSQIAVDVHGDVCFTRKAMRAADHLLVCRYLDYQQVVWNKTVAGLEEVLRDVLVELLKQRLISCSLKSIREMIEDGEQWHSFDDSQVLEKIKTLSKSQETSDDVRLMCSAILDRNPPRLVGEIEFIGERHGAERRNFDKYRQFIDGEIEAWAEEFNVPKRHWYVWTRDEPLTKSSSRAHIQEITEGVESEKKIKILRDKHQQSVKILDTNTRLSTPIMDIRNSLASVLADRCFYAIRVYVLLRPTDRETLGDNIRKKLRDYKLIEWN